MYATVAGLWQDLAILPDIQNGAKRSAPHRPLQVQEHALSGVALARILSKTLRGMSSIDCREATAELASICDCSCLRTSIVLRTRSGGVGLGRA